MINAENGLTQVLRCEIGGGNINHLINFVTKPVTRKSCNVTIGIPKAMMFFEHGKLWEDFFINLGCSVVSSGETNKHILDLGVKLCSNETCLPVKVFTGHVAELRGKSDFVFIPRYTSMDKYEMTCPKLCGLPDMVRHNLKNDFKMLEVAVDYDKGPQKTQDSLRNISKTLAVDYQTINSSFLRSFKNRLKTASMEIGSIEPESPSIAVLGHPYMIYDNMLSMNLINKLKENNFAVVTPDNLSRQTKRENSYPYNNRNFYDSGFDNLGSAFTYASMQNLKGIIYLTAFACGVDSLVTEFIERHLKQTNPVPLLKMTIDEHSGEAGFDTRLEAFLDMLDTNSRF